MSSNDPFETYYLEALGDRWLALRPHLLSGQESVWRLNRYASRDGLDGLTYQIEGIASEFLSQDGAVADADRCGLKAFYPMDLASVVVAEALGVTPEDRVLDMCAAPGGKALILGECLGENGRLTLNDLSRARRHRLWSVLESYVPAEVLQRITVTGHDATRTGVHAPDTYDRILLDAPCSSERHVMGSKAALQKWSPARTKQLAQRQYALLCSALLAVRPGGRVVYSTCSLLPNENDAVVRRLIKKKGSQFALLDYDSPFGSRTDFGWSILPDERNIGPIYFSVLEKR